MTTLMFRRLPRRYTAMALVTELREHVDRSSVDFVYLPFSTRTADNLGFAFVNFVDEDTASTILKAMDGKQWKLVQTSRSMTVVPAYIQGFRSNLEHCAQTVEPGAKENHLPLIFRDGELIPFHVAIQRFLNEQVGSTSAQNGNGSSIRQHTVMSKASATNLGVASACLAAEHGAPHVMTPPSASMLARLSGPSGLAEQVSVRRGEGLRGPLACHAQSATAGSVSASLMSWTEPSPALQTSFSAVSHAVASDSAGSFPHQWQQQQQQQQRQQQQQQQPACIQQQGGHPQGSIGAPLGSSSASVPARLSGLAGFEQVSAQRRAGMERPTCHVHDVTLGIATSSSAYSSQAPPVLQTFFDAGSHGVAAACGTSQQHLQQHARIQELDHAQGSHGSFQGMTPALASMPASLSGPSVLAAQAFDGRGAGWEGPSCTAHNATLENVSLSSANRSELPLALQASLGAVPHGAASCGVAQQQLQQQVGHAQGSNTDIASRGDGGLLLPETNFQAQTPQSTITPSSFSGPSDPSATACTSGQSMPLGTPVAERTRELLLKLIEKYQGSSAHRNQQT